MRQLFTGIVAFVGIIATASFDVVASDKPVDNRSEVVQKWVEAAESCLKKEGVFLEEGSRTRGCFVTNDEKPRIYCDKGLPNGKVMRDVLKLCFDEASTGARPQRFGQQKPQ